MKVLALSSSRVGGSGYLEKAVPFINDFLGTTQLNIAFIPFASVERSYDDLGAIVKDALQELGHQINVVYSSNAKTLLNNADAIMVSGGNTFKLLHDIYKYDLFELIREKVKEGIPYIGWSAGSNLTGKTICTTNDMPIIQPESFNAFGFFPFQINPHYFNLVQEGFHGETRDQRLSEYLHLNQNSVIVGLPEGTALTLHQQKLIFTGIQPGVLFSFENGKVLKEQIFPNQDLSFLLA